MWYQNIVSIRSINRKDIRVYRKQRKYLTLNAHVLEFRFSKENKEEIMVHLRLANNYFRLQTTTDKPLNIKICLTYVHSVMNFHQVSITSIQLLGLTL